MICLIDMSGTMLGWMPEVVQKAGMTLLSSIETVIANLFCTVDWTERSTTCVHLIYTTTTTTSSTPIRYDYRRLSLCHAEEKQSLGNDKIY